MAKVLIVDDDVELAKTIQSILQEQNWTTEVAFNGTDALQLLENFSYDLALLDWDLPDISGLDICGRRRRAGDKTPIIFITGKTEVDSLERALDMGADDYISKPLDVREMLARIRAMRRRASGTTTNELSVRGMALDTKLRKLRKDDSEVNLTALETDLLEFLMRNPNQPFSSADLFQRVWPSDSESNQDTVRVHVNVLRRKLGLAGCADLVKTILGKGYLVETP